MKYIFVAMLISLLLCAPLCAQPAPTTPTPDTTAKRDAEYHVGPADVLSIAVVDLPQLTRSVTISNSGKIHLPYLGVLEIASLTCPQIEEAIARKLRERQLVKDAWVHVHVQDYRAETVYVVGEVMMGGQYVIRDEMYLLDLLSLGMGLGGEWVSPIVYLYRRPLAAPGDDGGTGEGLLEAIPIPIEELFSGKKPELNLKLRGGDMLYCPERRREYVYVFGDVGRPGMIELDPKLETLVSRAISMAGGTLKTARLGKGVLVRRGKDGQREDIQIDFNALLHGKKPDFAVRPDDVIYIPGSAWKSLGYGLLGVIPGIAETAVVF